jgi:phage shock protein A
MMGIFGRMKRAAKSKANAAVDKMIDPAREIEMTLLELEKQHKEALKELLGYKQSVKGMERDLADLEEKAKRWEQRAMTAVKKGDDDLARQCLREKKTCVDGMASLKRDKAEADSYAIELNRSRKKVETQLQMLRLRKGTMATQIAAARSGTGNAFGLSNEAFEKLDRAGEKIETDAAMAEAASELEGDGLGESADSFDAKLLAAGADPREATGADGGGDALAQLKARMGKGGPKQLKK